MNSRQAYHYLRPKQPVLENGSPTPRRNPDSSLFKFVTFCLKIINSPDAVVAISLIAKDQDLHSQRKKVVRLEDQLWAEDPSAEYQEVNSEEVTLLQTGRKRLPPEAVFFFFAIKGYLGGSLKQTLQADLLMESTSIRDLMVLFGLEKAPGISTIIDHLNSLSHETEAAILKLTCDLAKSIGLDDFHAAYIDSTAIEANSAFPVESDLIMRSSVALSYQCKILQDHGLPIHIGVRCHHHFNKIGTIAKSIALASGKGAKKIRADGYRALSKHTTCVRKHIEYQLAKVEKIIDSQNLKPSRKRALLKMVEMAQGELSKAKTCSVNAITRVIKMQKVPTAEKVLSRSDEDASIIVKGDREAKFGFRPQISRSKLGLISGIIVPRGNANDAGQLTAIVSQVIDTTNVIPKIVSVDDGYASTQARDELLEIGVEVVSFGGSKGKKLLGKVWDQALYEEARNDRSMAESTMAELKDRYQLAEFSQRGIVGANHQLYAAAVAMNIKRLAA